MVLIQSLISFIGRFFISLIFISSGIHQILDWQGTEQLLSEVLNDWNGLVLGIHHLQTIFTYAESSMSLLIAAAIFCQVIGGLCILLGIQVRFGAFLLILFLIPVTVLFHHFWLMQGTERVTEMASFMKNLSILGGLLILLAYGKCKKSQKSEKSPTTQS